MGQENSLLISSILPDCLVKDPRRGSQWIVYTSMAIPNLVPPIAHHVILISYGGPTITTPDRR